MATPPNSLFKNYLHTLYEETDFAAHHRLHSDQAFLLAGPRPDRKRELPALAYVQFMTNTLQELGFTGRLRQRRPYLHSARLERVLPGEADEQVALVSLREGRSPTPLCAAFGVAEEQGRHLIRWVTLVPPGAEPDAARLKAQAHGELAYVPLFTRAEDLLLSMLEVSFYRQHMPPTAALSYLPEARFTCHGSSLCCQNSWSIRLTDGDRAALDARPAADNLRRLPVLGGKPLYKKLSTEEVARDELRPYQLVVGAKGTAHRCGFLTDDNRCDMHAEADLAVLHDCHVFPYGFTATPDGVAVWSNLFCPSVRYQKGRGFADNEADIRGRLQRLSLYTPSAFYRAADLPISWGAFCAAEDALLRYLDGHQPPIGQRLLGALAYLGRWQGEDPPKFEEEQRARDVQLPLIPPIPQERQLVQQVFGLITDSQFFRPVPPPAGALAAPGEGVADAPFLAYMLRTLVFSKQLSFSFGVLPGFNFAVLAYCLLLHRFAGWRWRDISEHDWTEYFKGLQHSHFRRVLNRLQEEAFFKELGKTPLFGELLLRATLSPPR